MSEYTVDTNWSGQEKWDLITFPSGDRLIYTEVPSNPSAFANHAYWRAKPNWGRGKRISGVSSIVESFSLGSGGLVKWIGREAASTGNPDPGSEKRDIGTRVHSVLEWLAADEEGERPSVEPADAPYVDALRRWWYEYKPEVLASEQFVYHPEFEYAGRLDLRVRLDGKVLLLDAKTSKSLRPQYGAQLVAYDFASERCGHGAADGLFNLWIPPEGDAVMVPVTTTRWEFLNALSVREAARREDKAQKAFIAAAQAVAA